MNHLKPMATLAGLASLIGINQAGAGIFIDTSPGTAAPPATLGGYSMIGFPADLSAEGSLTTSLTPPASAPVTGNLTFGTAVEHDQIGSLWSTWSHGYAGAVYYTDSYKLNLTLPGGTLAFYLYLQPNIYDDFTFDVTTESAVETSITINGNGGARYIGVYSDDPLDPVTFVFIKNPAQDADGFAVGEFGINVPEPGAFAWVTALGLAGLVFARRAQTR